MTDHDKHHPLRPILKNWVWEHGQIGTRYLDCIDGQIKFDGGKKSRFASEDYFYAPLGENDKEPAKTDGPAIQEAGLARFLHAAITGNAAQAGSHAEVQRAIHDCIELSLFSAYQHEARIAFHRYAQEPLFDEEIRDAVILEIRTRYAELYRQLPLYDYSVLYGLPSPLMICDTPFIDWRVRVGASHPFVTLPLAPHSLLVGAPSGRTSRAAPLQWKAVTTMGPLKDHNRYIAAQANLWLVATNDDQLAAVQSRAHAGKAG